MSIGRNLVSPDRIRWARAHALLVFHLCQQNNCFSPVLLPSITRVRSHHTHFGYMNCMQFLFIPGSSNSCTCADDGRCIVKRLSHRSRRSSQVSILLCIAVRNYCGHRNEETRNTEHISRMREFEWTSRAGGRPRRILHYICNENQQKFLVSKTENGVLQQKCGGASSCLSDTIHCTPSGQLFTIDCGSKWSPMGNPPVTLEARSRNLKFYFVQHSSTFLSPFSMIFFRHRISSSDWNQHLFI